MAIFMPNEDGVVLKNLCHSLKKKKKNDAKCKSSV